MHINHTLRGGDSPLLINFLQYREICLILIMSILLIVFGCMNLNSKYNVKLGALCGRVFPDYTDAVEKAPFDIDKNHMKIPTNEERIKVSQNLRSYLEITFLHFEMVTVLIKIDLHFLHFHVFCN